MLDRKLNAIVNLKCVEENMQNKLWYSPQMCENIIFSPNVWKSHIFPHKKGYGAFPKTNEKAEWL
jgi:hypothetical protein